MEELLRLLSDKAFVIIGPKNKKTTFFWPCRHHFFGLSDLNWCSIIKPDEEFLLTLLEIQIKLTLTTVWHAASSKSTDCWWFL